MDLIETTETIKCATCESTTDNAQIAGTLLGNPVCLNCLGLFTVTILESGFTTPAKDLKKEDGTLELHNTCSLMLNLLRYTQTKTLEHLAE